MNPCLVDKQLRLPVLPTLRIFCRTKRLPRFGGHAPSFRNNMKIGLLGMFILMVFSSAAVEATSITLQPVADTTLQETYPTNNFGGGTSIQAGTRRYGGRTRGLLRFDLSSSVPSNAIITAATVTLTVVETPVGGGVNSVFDLNRLLASWGEGAGSDHRGSPGLAGEATWNTRFGPGTAWLSPGGDYRAIAKRIGDVCHDHPALWRAHGFGQQSPADCDLLDASTHARRAGDGRQIPIPISSGSRAEQRSRTACRLKCGAVADRHEHSTSGGGNQRGHCRRGRDQQRVLSCSPPLSTKQVGSLRVCSRQVLNALGGEACRHFRQWVVTPSRG